MVGLHFFFKPFKFVFAGSEYHQYDFFVYPKAINLEKGIFRRGLEKSLLGFHSIFEREFSPPSTEEMVKQCFHFYLKPYKNVLLSETGYPQHFELNMFVREINHIFEQHEKPLVQHNPSLCTLVRVDNMKEVRTLFIPLYLHLLPNRNLKDGLKGLFVPCKPKILFVALFLPHLLLVVFQNAMLLD